ncbi:MAG: putative dsRNA-binding protein, partial [Chloroflexota bacterium]|nr:putative dsRNA-binding protein [Chloroflexota bacterium]
VKPIYQLVDTTGPPHDQEFRVTVVIGGTAFGLGAGSSRQRAEEQAAQAALTGLPEGADGVTHLSFP